MQKGTANQGAEIQRPAAPSGRCFDCNLWQPMTYLGQGPARQVANIGYCLAFGKYTTPDHGEVCAVHNPLASNNQAQRQPPTAASERKGNDE